MKNAKTYRSLLFLLLTGWCLLFLRCESTEKSMVRAVYLAQTEQGYQAGLLYQAPQAAADAAEAAALARTLGQVWQASPTAGLYAITADADFEAHFGKKAAKRRKIYNGMIPCQIYMYFDRPVKPVRK